MDLRIGMLLVCAVWAVSSGIAPAQETATMLSPELVAAIRAKTDVVQPKLVEIRRQIHMHPELSSQEKETSALVAKRLTELGLEVKTNVGGYGVVGLLKGGKPGPIVAYRADMDAVNSPVVGDVAYKSQVPNVKHVCGHDAHVAVGLGIAEVLSSIKEQLPGAVKFIFQPAEENIQGAKAMIKDGVLTDPAPDAIFGVHTAPVPAGFIGCPVGVGFSGIRNLRVTLIGTDAAKLDAAQAELIDALKALSTVPQLDDPAKVSSILAAITVKDGPLSEFVYILARKGETKDAQTRNIEVSLRASGPAAYEKGKTQIADTYSAMVKDRELQGAHTSSEEQILPDMHSDADLVLAAVPAITSMLGAGRTIMVYATVPYFGEDFSYFQETVPGAMFFMGVSNPQKGFMAFNHTPDYDLDEDGIAVAVKAMSGVLLDYMLTHLK